VVVWSGSINIYIISDQWISGVLIMAESVRAFLSVDIDDDALLSRIAHIQGRLDRDAAKMKLVERENIHYTWRFFGDTPVAKLEQIREELGALSFKPFTIEVAGVGAFPNIRRPRVIWVGATQNADKMVNLKKATDELLGNVGYPVEKKRFTPHATIARVRFIRDRDRMLNNLESLTSESIGMMTVEGIRMTKSTLTSSGPIYETLWGIELG
jgi:2'-5' RNA ligase